MLGATTNIQCTPLLNVEWGRSPASGLKQSNQFLFCDFFAGHCARRPAVKQQQLNGKGCFADFASFNHMWLNGS